MIILLIGILIGLVISVIVILTTKRFQSPIERTLKQVENKFKEKGEVFMPNEEREELESFINSLPRE